MAEIEFNYKGNKTIIQCNPNDKIKDIIKKFCTKIENDKDKMCFLYAGNRINEELTFREQANNIDKERKIMSILVSDIMSNINNSNINKSLIKSKTVICPECKENIRIDIQEYKIKLYDCKNGHKRENILLNQFESTQFIDESKIICEICKTTNKSESYDKKFNRCFICKKNLCHLCKSKHDKTHYIYIIDYDQKNYLCDLHFDSYNSYCKYCKKDICVICEQDHSSHEKSYYGEMIPNINNLNNKMNDLKKWIDEYKNYAKKIIEKLNNNIENLNIYYKINNDIITNFEVRNRNFPILQNLKDINTHINDFLENFRIKNINTIVDIYNKIIKEEETCLYKKETKFNNEISKELNLKKENVNVNVNEYIKNENKIKENINEYNISNENIIKEDEYNTKNESIEDEDNGGNIKNDGIEDDDNEYQLNNDIIEDEDNECLCDNNVNIEDE